MQLSARSIRLFFALGSVVAGVVACSSATSGFDSSTGGGQGFAGPTVSGGSVSPGPPPSRSFEACPQNVPIEGDACFGGACEYGGSADPACNLIARCSTETNAWTFEQPVHCPTTCPAHFDERVPGASCSGADLCTYLEATCGCAGAIDGAWTSIQGGSNNFTSDAGADASPSDGGDAGPSAIGQWQCIRPGNGCPARRPVEGTRCTKAMDCDYGTCVFGVPLAMTCINERWTALYVGSCP